MIKTYRGMLADGGQDRIRIKTNRGDIGYRITKFQVIPNTPGLTTCESILKVYKLKQSSIDGVIDFTDGDILAATYYMDQNNPQYSGYTGPIIFDREIFNQDIYVTSVDVDSATAMNYYLELEQIKLNENESTMATLQSLRQVAER